MLFGLTVKQARQVADREGFRLDEQLVEDGFASGLIFDQKPLPGVRTDCGSVIEVMYSGVG